MSETAQVRASDKRGSGVWANDNVYLELLWRERYSPDGTHADCPRCKRKGVVFKRYATKQARQSWTCTGCGMHVHPTAGTMFHKSSTPLHLWFQAMRRVESTRGEISVSRLARELGLSRTTTRRMISAIRKEAEWL